MTYFLQDILRQPQELERAISYLSGAGRHTLQTAAVTIRKARHVYLTGIGSSWNAAFGASAIFYGAGRPVYLQDAGELLQFATFPAESVIIAISRSGRTVEIVNLLAKARESEATVIGITNSADSVLAQEAQISILLPTLRDHAVSVNTYSALALAAAALACAVVDSFDEKLAISLSTSVAETERRIPNWQEQIAGNNWFAPGKLVHFLARGGSLGSCYEARLLWEEGAKSEATALGTASFRHGPQEMVVKGSRFGIWVDRQRGREQDLSVARDLRRLGASVVLIGQNLPPDSGDLVFQLPSIPAQWQFMIDILPAQLAAEYLARLSGVDCDSFRICSYIVEDEFGLIGTEGAAQKGVK
ncbi:MAG: SIS domain-containing protein [Acidobacteriia bacterium]|nr:SIS domain-containing protein [Terriglobia bacterium]